MLDPREEYDIAISESFRNETPVITVCSLEQPLWKARLAAALVEKWGLVAAVPEGEDSSGRAKQRLATPDELVARAVETADKLVDTVRERGWVKILPTVAEAKEIRAKQEQPK